MRSVRGCVTQLNIRLDADAKERWQEYVEESPEYSSVSGLIRAAVAREVRGAGGANGPSDASGRLHDRVADVEDTLADVETAVNALDGKVGRIADAIEADRALADLAPEVFAALPPCENRKAAREAFISPPTDPDAGGPVEGYGTVGWLAEQVGVSTDRTRDALDKLKRDTARVRSIQIDGRPHYWKEV